RGEEEDQRLKLLAATVKQVVIELGEVKKEAAKLRWQAGVGRKTLALARSAHASETSRLVSQLTDLRCDVVRLRQPPRVGCSVGCQTEVAACDLEQ
ncbi:unnamed protein product, partial [Discosporangium mesarthrocarpum]